MTLREFLKQCMVRREDIDRFLDPAEPNWAKFDAELGYGLKTSVMRDGVDGSWTLANYAESGERVTLLYSGSPCRINTYGDSFTQCQQVSDGESWQSCLAAHFGEPIRNYGVGGYGVYQAYRRMLREEKLTAAQYVILNIYAYDDHVRSFDSWRWIRLGGFREEFQTTARNYFHSNPWAHARFDISTGKLVEIESVCPTPESLYGLSDFDFVYETWKNDLQLHLTLARERATDYDRKLVAATGEFVGVKADLSTPETAARSARTIQLAYGLKVSMEVVRMARDFAARSGKKFMILLSYDEGQVLDACRGGARWDAGFLGFLDDEGIQYADSRAKHAEEFATFRLTPEEYVSRYYIGHYNPMGNHFFAFAVKDRLVEWLDPKPVTYSAGGPSVARAAGKLA
jgi:hypothetical protein